MGKIISVISVSKNEKYANFATMCVFAEFTQKAVKTSDSEIQSIVHNDLFK